ncbi:MAG: restriction endonuclease subunit S [Candidatus Methanoperedens sp.]|nr:restriction endonuclease subunit S [Candidatus Methanoperedens sp.]
MKPEILFDNFEVLTEAPNGVQKLRELILQLAISGKLVPQNLNNEPASELLKRIHATKRNSIAKKKLKKEELLASIPSNGIPYKAPNGWEWVRLGDISERIHYGYTASADPLSTAIRMLRITDIQDNQVNWSTVPGCQIDEIEFSKYELHQNDILITRTGGTIGKTFLVEDLPLKAVFASYLIRVVPSPLLSARFLKLFLESPFYWDQIRANSAGTGQPNVNGVALSNLKLTLPPLEEQRRIVARVDQLMALCDELEARQQKKRETRAHLNSAALDRLLAARAPGEFAEGWRRISDNFDLLYDAPENVGALRQAILQLAVMGKLVEQDERDEPASVLLEKIKAEKEQLIKDKKINNVRALQTIDADEIPYNLPRKWKWVHLGDVCHDWGQKKPDVEFTYIDVSAIDKEHGIISEDVKILKPNEAPSRARKIVSKGTII